MNIKQASEQSGVSAPNIRFYEKEGLLTPARRQGNDYRDYTAGNVRTLKLIRMLRMLDVPLLPSRRYCAGNSPATGAASPADRAGAAGGAAGGSHAVLRRPCPAGSADRHAGRGRLPDPHGKPRPAAGLLLRLAAGLLHAGAGAASKALFLYSAGQHQHPAGVYGGFAGLCRGKGNAVYPDQRGNVPEFLLDDIAYKPTATRASTGTRSAAMLCIPSSWTQDCRSGGKSCCISCASLCRRCAPLLPFWRRGGW